MAAPPDGADATLEQTRRRVRPRLPEGLLLPFATSAASAEESEQLSGETGARSVYKLGAPDARVSRFRALLSKTPRRVSIHSEPRTAAYNASRQLSAVARNATSPLLLSLLLQQLRDSLFSLLANREEKKDRAPGCSLSRRKVCIQRGTERHVREAHRCTRSRSFHRFEC